jgi:hypothetical protein
MWLDITVEQYIDIYYELNNFTDEESLNKRLISIFYNINIDEIDDMSYTDVYKKIESVQFLKKQIPVLHKKEILINCKYKFHLIPFNQLEFSAFIDLEYWLTKDKVYINNIPAILTILWRIKTKNADDLYPEEYEKYTGFGNRIELFNDVRIVDVYGSLMSYLDFRHKIFTTNEGMFNEKEDDEEEDISNYTASERAELEKEKKTSKWGYELLLMKLANNEPLKIESAMNMPVTRAFNILALLFELKIG